MNEVIQILKDRIHELRAKYRDKPEIEWLYRYREAQRCLELVSVEQIRSQQDARQGQGGTASASPNH